MATVAGQGCAPRGIPFSNPQARDAVRSRLADPIPPIPLIPAFWGPSADLPHHLRLGPISPIISSVMRGSAPVAVGPRARWPTGWGLGGPPHGDNGRNGHALAGPMGATTRTPGCGGSRGSLMDWRRRLTGSLPASGEASELGYVDQLERRSPCAPPLPRCSACNESHCPGTHPASGIVMYSPPGPAGRRYDQRAAIKSLQDGGAIAAPDALGQPRAASRRARLATVPATPAACQRRRRGQRPAPVARAAAGPDPRRPLRSIPPGPPTALTVSPARVRANARASRSRRISMQDNAARGASDQRQVEHQRPAPPRARD